jgi:mannose-6-phosphate isomerase-like protein (cupin superfamily)
MEEDLTDQHEWPDELDAVVAAPEHHKLLFENDAVRVLDTSIAPGETTPLHAHAWPATLYILSWSSFVRRDENGATILDSRAMAAVAPGSALWSPPLPPHTLENVGTDALHVIAVELKALATERHVP